MSLIFSRDFDRSLGIDDGIGAAITYARSGTAYGFRYGQLTSFAANQPRVATSNDDAHGFLIEAAAENLFVDEDFQTSDWSTIRCSKTDTETRGGLRGQEFTDDVTGDNTHIILQDVAGIVSTTKYCVSFIVRSDGSTPWLYFSTNAVSSLPKTYFDVVNGVVGSSPGHDDQGVIPLGDGLFLLWVVFTADVTGSKAMEIYQTTADNLNAFVGDGTHKIWLYESQVEVGIFPTSRTRVVDAKGGDTASAALANSSEHTMMIEGIRGIGAGVIMSWDDGTENERVRLEIDATGDVALTITDGGVEQSALTGVALIPENTFFRFAFSFRSNSLSASLDGAGILGDGSLSIPTLTTLRFGDSPTGSEEFHGHVAKVYIWDERSTDNEIVTLAANGVSAPAATGRIQIGIGLGL